MNNTVLFLRSNGLLNEKSASLADMASKPVTRIVKICTSHACAPYSNSGAIKETKLDDCPDCSHALFHQRMSENEIKRHNQKQYLQRRNVAGGKRHDKRAY